MVKLTVMGSVNEKNDAEVSRVLKQQREHDKHLATKPI